MGVYSTVFKSDFSDGNPRSANKQLLKTIMVGPDCRATQAC